MVEHFKLDYGPPNISASSYIVTNLDTGEQYFSKQEHTVRQVASLTKIMTFWVVLQFIEKWGIDPEERICQVLTTSTSEYLGGTSAHLLAGDRMSIFELFHGMMLPSGNDAA